MTEIRPLTEGYLGHMDKGGHNGPSQITERPAPPAPINPRPAMRPATLITLQPIAGGISADSIMDATRVADRLEVCVKMNINGIEVFVIPGDRWQTIAANYEETMKRGGTFVGANVISSSGKTEGTE
jgi:hypothetical protein